MKLENQVIALSRHKHRFESGWEHSNKPVPPYRSRHKKEMEEKLTRLVSFFVLIIFSSPSFAGDRGYYLVFYDLEHGVGKKLMGDYRDHSQQINSPCWDKRSGKGIGVVYYKKPIEGISLDLVRRSIEGDRDTARKISLVFKNFTDDQITYGFDGLLSFASYGGENFIYSLTMDGKMTKTKIEGKTTLKDFDLAICRSLAPIDRHFLP